MTIARSNQPTRALSDFSHAYIWTAVAIGSIWVSTGIVTFFAPDFISGAQHEHLPLAAWTAWLWGAIATGFVVLASIDGMRRKVATTTAWMALGISCAAIWLGVALVGILAPVFVTGGDPTSIPFGALLAPVIGMMLTWFACTFVRTAFASADDR